MNEREPGQEQIRKKLTIEPFDQDSRMLSFWPSGERDRTSWIGLAAGRVTID